ncbi:MAG: hypoxanthine-guanine phosphoribosyltransferase [Halobacteria archaeon]|nr:hypoxanthine-guanine phosphoribosyltransferase [Halobacteria archaeon]
MTNQPLDLHRLRQDAVMLYGPEDVHQALDRMAAGIDEELSGTVPVILCVLTGGIIPAGHLLTRLAFPLEIGYLHASRYRGNTTGTDEISWLCKSQVPLQDRTVLVIDDILDEGHTLSAVTDYCRQEGAAHTYSCVLIEKLHDRRQPGVTADFVGLQVEDKYVFGFGMDYKGYMRNLNGIYALGPGHE